VYKHQNALELWCGGALRGRYRATFGAHPWAPKVQRGDERTPEGAYHITSRVSTPRFHRFLGVSYPNAVDRRRSAALGVRDPGGGIGIHGVERRREGLARLWLEVATSTGLGQLWGPTDGCVALANEDIDVVYAAARVGTPVRIEP
jgi:murein L,D-transpeptidase YafK